MSLPVRVAKKRFHTDIPNDLNFVSCDFQSSQVERNDEERSCPREHYVSTARDLIRMRLRLF
jgi:hypothetical protein